MQTSANNSILKHLFSMSEVKRIPKLRFSGFYNEWKIHPFKDLVKINQGLQISISERLTSQEEGTLFYITNEFLREKSEKKYFIKNAPKSVICKKDDILMTRTGNTGKVVTNVEGVFHNNFFKIAYPKNIDKDFLVNFLNLVQTQNFILRLAGTSTIPDLNHSDFYKIKLIYPDLTEQQKIASFLTSVDKKIEQLQQKKTLLEQYKKGIMQQIFSQKLRFKDNDGNAYSDWDVKVFKNICNIVGGGTPDTSNDDYWNGGIQWFTPTEIKQDVVSKSIRTISEVGLQKSSAKVLPVGTILMTTRATIGEVAIALEECSTNQGFQSLIVNEDIDNIFIFNWIKMNKNELMKRANGSTFSEISKTEIEKIKITLPSKKEQSKIANFLSTIDKKILLVNNQLENTQQFKKGLLQQMFV